MLIDNRTRQNQGGLRERLDRLGILREPLGYLDGANLYEFVGSNPVNGIDPTGLWRLGPGNSIVVVPGDTPGGISRDLTGEFENWPQVFPNLDDPTRLQPGSYNVDPNIIGGYRKAHEPPPAKPAPATQTSQPTTQPADTSGQPAGAAARPKCPGTPMWVTAYNDKGKTSGGQQAGQGIVAAGDTSWRKTPGTPRGQGEHRIHKGAADPAYPYGSHVTVYDADGKAIYQGTIQDTGRGWIRNGFPSDGWIDIWLPGDQAIQFGKQQLNVEITPPTPTP